jgi:hypothetical protein
MMMSSRPAQTNWDFHFGFPGQSVIYIWLFQFSSFQLSSQLQPVGYDKGNDCPGHEPQILAVLEDWHIVQGWVRRHANVLSVTLRLNRLPSFDAPARKTHTHLACGEPGERQVS